MTIGGSFSKLRSMVQQFGVRRRVYFVVAEGKQNQEMRRLVDYTTPGKDCLGHNCGRNSGSHHHLPTHGRSSDAKPTGKENVFALRKML